jgi:hypothetical protein
MPQSALCFQVHIDKYKRIYVGYLQAIMLPEQRWTELGRLFDELEKFVASENIGPWLKQPNPAFDNSLAGRGTWRDRPHMADAL